MTRPKRNDEPIAVTKQDLMRILSEDDSIKTLLQTMLEELLEAEMDAALQAAKSGPIRHYGLGVVLRNYLANKQNPQDVDQQKQRGGQFARGPRLRAKSAEPSTDS